MDTKKMRKKIGSHLQLMRKAAGFKSAKAFAEYVGFNANTYTQYEQGLVSFTYEKAWLMADALQCTLDELGGRTPPAEREYADPAQEALNGYYESMNADGRDALVASARLMSGSPDTRIEKEGKDLPIPAEMERIA